MTDCREFLRTERDLTTQVHKGTFQLRDQHHHASQPALRVIRGEFLRRRRKNSAYSLRAFGRDLAVSPSVLSEVLSQKRPLTEMLIRRIAAGLDLDLAQKRQLLGSLGQRSSPTRSKRALRAEQFQLVADWYHFAILNLTLTVDFDSDNGWISRRLGITAAEAAGAVDRLLTLGLLEWKGGRLVRTFRQVVTETDIPSGALRLSHRQSLGQAIECIDKVPVDMRDITSLTIPFDVAQMPQVKAKINKFLLEISQLTRSGTSKREVFNLNVQFVPVTRLHGRGHKEDRLESE